MSSEPLHAAVKALLNAEAANAERDRAALLLRQKLVEIVRGLRRRYTAPLLAGGRQAGDAELADDALHWLHANGKLGLYDTSRDTLGPWLWRTIANYWITCNRREARRVDLADTPEPAAAMPAEESDDNEQVGRVLLRETVATAGILHRIAEKAPRGGSVCYPAVLLLGSRVNMGNLWLAGGGPIDRLGQRIGRLLAWSGQEEAMRMRDGLATIGEVWGRLERCIDEAEAKLTGDGVVAVVNEVSGSPSKPLTAATWSQWRHRARALLSAAFDEDDCPTLLRRLWPSREVQT